MISTSAILVYGIPIPSDHPCRAYGNEEHLDGILKRHPGVSHASAGPYDQNTRYIVTDFHEAECGRYSAGPAIVVDTFGDMVRAERNARLENAAMDLIITDHPDPAWYLIANQD